MTKTRSTLVALCILSLVACTATLAYAQQQRDPGEPRADAPQSQPDNQREGPDAEGDGGDDEGKLPFNMDRLFVPRWRLADGPQVKAAFRDVIHAAAAATVTIKCDGKRRGLGGVVGADGWILTKATPLCGKVTCTLPDGRELSGTTVGENHDYDLALVKVDAHDLPALDLSDVTVPPVGAWLATVGMERDPVAVGVVSVGPREIPPQAGILGVMLDQTDASQPVVEQVFKDSAAETAGVKVGDRIVSVDGVATRTRQELIERVRTFSPGDEVTLAIERGSEKVTLHATLGGAFPAAFAGRSEFQNNLGGRLSVRRFGFPVALQHDAVLQPDECGGPVVDLDGRVIGFNIARAGRTESYAIPTSALRGVIAELLEEGMAAATKLEKNRDGEKKTTTSTPTAPSPASNNAEKPQVNDGAASRRNAPRDSAKSRQHLLALW
jgi:serine protease Do